MIALRVASGPREIFSNNLSFVPATESNPSQLPSMFCARPTVSALCFCSIDLLGAWGLPATSPPVIPRAKNIISAGFINSPLSDLLSDAQSDRLLRRQNVEGFTQFLFVAALRLGASSTVYLLGPS